jgi:hypothetical protein
MIIILNPQEVGAGLKLATEVAKIVKDEDLIKMINTIDTGEFAAYSSKVISLNFSVTGLTIEYNPEAYIDATNYLINLLDYSKPIIEAVKSLMPLFKEFGDKVTTATKELIEKWGDDNTHQ